MIVKISLIEKLRAKEIDTKYPRISSRSFSIYIIADNVICSVNIFFSIQGKFLSCSFQKLPWSYSRKFNSHTMQFKYFVKVWILTFMVDSLLNYRFSRAWKYYWKMNGKAIIRPCFQWLSLWLWFADLAKLSILFIKTVFLTLRIVVLSL